MVTRVALLCVLLASPAAWADDSKISKEKIDALEVTSAAGKEKRCCGYPLAAARGFALRYYWLAHQVDHTDYSSSSTIYSQRGMFLGIYNEQFIRALTLEGSGVLSDGRVINYDGKCGFGVGTCFQILSPRRYPFGRGAHRRPLVPFRSVAVDKKLIDIGDVLYLAELDGVPLPNGEVHDGCVRADDTGGGIKKQKLDFFVVKYSNFRFLLRRLWGINWVTPHVEAPHCQYLKNDDRPLHYRGVRHVQ